MRYPILTLLLLASLFLPAQEWSMDDITVYRDFDDFEHLLKQDNDSVYVINFWATWCAPCVKELPYFEALNKRHRDKKFRMVLVSLDFERQLETRLLSFLNKKKIKSDVVVLLDGKESEWIDRVDERWSGAIPITIVYKGDRWRFYEKNFHSVEELEAILQELE